MYAIPVDLLWLSAQEQAIEVSVNDYAKLEHLVLTVRTMPIRMEAMSRHAYHVTTGNTLARLDPQHVMLVKRLPPCVTPFNIHM